MQKTRISRLANAANSINLLGTGWVQGKCGGLKALRILTFIISQFFEERKKLDTTTASRKSEREKKHPPPPPSLPLPPIVPRMLVSLTIIAVLATALATAGAAPPNVVFFLADDLGWNDVSFHGSAQIPTPTLDKLAREGVTLDQYYVNPVCSPTRGSLMSGRSMMHTGIQTPYGAGDDASGLNLTYTTLPEQLKLKHGYVSYMV